MFSSLRARLWLSYALVIVAALLLTVVVLALYLLRSPLAYRSTLLELEAARNVLIASQPDLSSLSGVKLESTLKTYDQALGVRLVLLGDKRQVLADSRIGAEAPIVAPRRFQILQPTIGLRDESGENWLYVAEALPEGRTLLLLTPRPRLPLLTILRNDLFLPFVYAGALALALSLFVAFGLARWIGNPLQALVSASRQMPETRPLALRGPREVQELTGAFNEMSARVNATQKAQREFVANVSHELKTPITSIQGFAQAMQDGTADTPEARQQAASVIQQESGRMYRMVLDLLDLARLDSGTLDLERVPVDVPALLNSVAEKFTPQARTAGVSIQVVTPPLPSVIGDGDRLAQVFSNLVDNALKYSPTGGSITLSASADASRIQVAVVDTGKGIPREAQPYIFERFYQADPSRPGGKKHGAGLGLAIVQEIVRAHGGTISVRSNPGEGSTFAVSLPITRSDDTTAISKRKK
ncbi:MAG: HAMP domain-containing histidine kinase [Chloroflexi bacterium]|nr:HAMP domain-containing histidine kinase [Chloroflexota bacterium]